MGRAVPHCLGINQTSQRNCDLRELQPQELAHTCETQDMSVFNFSSSDPRGVTCGAATLSTERIRVDHREYQKYTVECEEGSACPAAEERLPIEVVLDAVHRLKYENYTSSFFIRDISECT